ncbi:glycosyltransferase family 9 protein [Accumulibacter sp.]|uniref:glycosyltransferase family 9 protein n=1 Tax=Accumulibacter sp. TaxID=2053492 RepID=UPI0025CEC007|nr:glycosyltransferase family 9 protein [Accumulibacter sp.]MCM8593928.1 glycosyltransferase family 9 protein [Accumulibacter sp.]MCM8627777.1 glycosyltransferase family 9 protein [Accumulibacter sp.]MDS4048069.1 glycosyltransferase family 9 protein [Accumulibacter sp.]
MPESSRPAVLLFRESTPVQGAPPIENLPARTEIRRILIVKWGGMGDVVISTAIIEDICRAFPGRELDLNAMPPWDRLFARDPRFSRVWTVDLRRSERGIRGAWRWLQLARGGDYDLIVDLQCNDRTRLLLSALICSKCRTCWRIGNLPVFPYNLSAARMPQETHVFQRLRACLAAAGIPALTARPVVHWSDEESQRARAILVEHGVVPGEFALFLPGSHAAGLTKRWGVDNYRRLALLLTRRGLGRIVLLGGPDEIDECAAIARGLEERVVDLCGRTKLLELPPIAAAARFVVANDTGTAHLASASCSRMLVICGPTDPRRVKPVGDGVVAIQADLPCRNCYLKTCSHHSCMKAITPEDVVALLDQQIDRGG